MAKKPSTESDLSLLARQFEGLPEALDRNLSRAVHIAGEQAAAYARENHDYQDRTGTLTNSIASSGPLGSFANDDLHTILSAGASYARYVEKGTRPHEIKARRRKALRWPVAGGFAFAKSVKHPGTKGTFFLQKAIEHVEPVLAEKLVPQAVELSFIEIGFGAD